MVNVILEVSRGYCRARDGDGTIPEASLTGRGGPSSSSIDVAYLVLLVTLLVHVSWLGGMVISEIKSYCDIT